MKKAPLTSIAALFLATGTAHAEALLPPIQYDHVYPNPVLTS
jgi:hypothetical protein